MTHGRGRVYGCTMALSWWICHVMFMVCSRLVGGMCHGLSHETRHKHVMVHPMSCHPCAMDVPWTYHGQAMATSWSLMDAPWSCHGLVMMSDGVSIGMARCIHSHSMVMPRCIHNHSMAAPRPLMGAPWSAMGRVMAHHDRTMVHHGSCNGASVITQWCIMVGPLSTMGRDASQPWACRGRTPRSCHSWTHHERTMVLSWCAMVPPWSCHGTFMAMPWCVQCQPWDMPRAKPSSTMGHAPCMIMT